MIVNNVKVKLKVGLGWKMNLNGLLKENW